MNGLASSAAVHSTPMASSVSREYESTVSGAKLSETPEIVECSTRQPTLSSTLANAPLGVESP